MNNGEKERNSAFELLRIVAMFMVVLGHCVLATAKNTKPYLGIMDNLGWLVGAFTAPAVNLFFLLTGFFADYEVRIKKGIMLWGKVIFYSFSIYCIFAILNGDLSHKDAIQYMCPILMKKYWFMQTYIVLFFLLPIIVKGLNQLEEKELQRLLIVLIAFFSVHETFIKVQYTLDDSQGYGIIWAVVMSVLGYYLRKMKDRWNNNISMWICLGIYIAISIAIFLSNYLIVKYDIAAGITSRGNFYAYNSVTVLVQSMALFCVFIRWSEKWTMPNSCINFMGKHVLAVYLISAHPLLLYPLWTDYLRMQSLSDKPIIYFLSAMFWSGGVMLACVLIDYLLFKLFHVIYGNIKV